MDVDVSEATKYSPNSQPIKLLVYPLAPDNPYQQLLYDALKKNDLVEAKLIKIPTTLPGFLFQIFIILFELIANRLKGYRLIHIHWLYQLGFPGKPIWPWLSRLITTVQIRLFLFSAKLLGYSLVWTIHDVLPHYLLTLDDIKTTQLLLDKCSKLIALSSATVEKLGENKLTYKQSKLAIVPHGNYIGSYADTSTRLEARNQLHLPANAFIFLFFGTILPYKNASGMLEAFENIAKRHSNAVIVIAGKAADADQRAKINSAQKRLGKKLKTRLDFIADDDVQYYFNAADFVVFPYLRITNSGVAILAASFAKPVVAPKLGAFNDLPKASGLFYKAGSQQALEQAMELAILKSTSQDTMSMASKEYAESLSWDKIAKQTYMVYDQASRA